MKETTQRSRTQTDVPHPVQLLLKKKPTNPGSRKLPPECISYKTCRPACIFQRDTRISPHSADSCEPTHPNTAQTEVCILCSSCSTCCGPPHTHTETHIEKRKTRIHPHINTHELIVCFGNSPANLPSRVPLSSLCFWNLTRSFHVLQRDTNINGR